MNFYVFFDRHIFNILSLYDFSSILILLGSKFYIGNIIKKVVCPVFYIYMFNFIIIFNLRYQHRTVLILRHAMVVNVFVLLNILSHNI